MDKKVFFNVFVLVLIYRYVYQRATGQRASFQGENCFFLLIFQVLGWYLTFSMHGQLYFVLFISIWTAVITAAEHHAYHTVPQYTRMLL